MKKLTMKRMKQLLIVLVSVLVMPIIALASSPAFPSIPLFVYGDVTIDGQPAPIGTKISAKIKDTEIVVIATTAKEGKYYIEIPDGKTNEGKTIVFKVNGIVVADENGSYKVANVSEVPSVKFDLAVATTQSCSISNGQGTQTWDESVWEEGTQTWDESPWGDCVVESCDSGYHQSNNSCVINSTGGGGYTPSSNTSSLNNHLKISSTQTGTLNQSLSDGKNVKVKIPKGSIKSTTTFAVSKGSLENGDVPKDKVGAFLFDGLVFSVKAVDTNNKAIKSFSKDLTITLTVPDLPANTSNLGLYYFDDKNNKWVVIENVEFGNDTITFKVNHLTKFAVFTVKEKSSDSSKSKGKVLSAESVNIVDGDIIQAQTSSDPFAVYIVKIVGSTKYIRHIVSLEIFNHYGNLKWENLKQVDSLDGYSLSGWVRVNTGPNGTPGPTDKVYEINGDQTKHWINMTAEQFLSHGGSDAAIYTVNQGELNLYTTGPDVVSI